MLPDAYDSPASVNELLVLPAVPRHVRVKFRRPPWAVVPRRGPVVWAPVPEAAIHEDRETRPSEHDVRPTGQLPVLLAEPEPAAVQLPAQCQLRASVTARHALH